MSTVDDIYKALNSVLVRIKSNALKVLAREARESINKNFESSGRPVRWKVSKRVQKHGGKTLIKSGALMRRINIVIDESSSSVKVGSTLPYARIHHEGGEIKRKSGNVITIPARPYLSIPEEDYPRIVRNIQQAIK